MEELCMDMGKAITECVPCEIDSDVWTQVARHGPGQQQGVAVANRSVIYLLRPADGEPFLALLNGLWVDEAGDQPFRGLRALEAKTGARLRYILSPGDGHHLSLHHYARAFPEARVCVADGRIPRENPELVALDNVDVYPIDAPPAELAAAGLKIHVIRGLMEGPLTKRLQLLTAMRWGYVPGSAEGLMVLHEPSGRITSGGHQWWFVPEGHDGVFEVPRFMGFMMGLMGLDLSYMQPGRFTIEPNGGFAVHDKEALQQSCREVLSWEFDKLLDLHAPLNSNPESGAKALFEEVMGPIVDGDWARVPWKVSTLPG